MSAIETAWDLIGSEGQFRIQGGRTIYEAAEYVGTERSVKLAYLKPTDRGIRQINRYVDPDTRIEVLRNFTAEAQAERDAEMESIRRMEGMA